MVLNDDCGKVAQRAIKCCPASTMSSKKTALIARAIENRLVPTINCQQTRAWRGLITRRMPKRPTIYMTKAIRKNESAAARQRMAYLAKPARGKNRNIRATRTEPRNKRTLCLSVSRIEIALSAEALRTWARDSRHAAN